MIEMPLAPRTQELHFFLYFVLYPVVLNQGIFARVQVLVSVGWIYLVLKPIRFAEQLLVIYQV
jgi:hypothetical protein